MIPDDLLAFMGSAIKSVWTLELLLFLRRNASRSWTADELVRELRGSEFVVSQGLSELGAAGLVSPDGGETYRYAPAAPYLDGLVGRLEETYAARPSTVVRAILTAPNDKLQTFADAFKLRRE